MSSLYREGDRHGKCTKDLGSPADSIVGLYPGTPCFKPGVRYCILPIDFNTLIDLLDTWILKESSHYESAKNDTKILVNLRRV